MDTCIHNDLVELESRSDILSKEKGELQHLTNGILGMQWLTSDHMSNVNKLMIKDEYSLHGFQDTLLAPVKKKNGTWHIPASGFKNQKQPSANIHYNGQKHRVTSFQFEDGDIFLLDSDLGKKICLTDSLKIQLAQIYGQGKSKLKVKIPHVQQQNNSYNCGLFAIANMIKFATNRYNGLKDGKLEFMFIQNEMRTHLIKCFNQNYMEPFPKEKMQQIRTIKVSSIDIDLFCCCSVPEVSGLGPWIAYDTCDQWYLQKCEGINGKKIHKNQLYICKNMWLCEKINFI